MHETRRAPDTAEGEYVLHDFRSVDWTGLGEMPSDEREDALTEAVTFLQNEAARAEDKLGCFTVIGHKADLLIMVLRPTLGDLDTFERRFQQLEFASLTERTTSALGVTEASGYSEAAAAYFDSEAETDPGIARYIETRLHPSLPETEFLSFYFMNKRRGAAGNWYDLSYEERAEHVTRHGQIGRQYGGSVTQLITGTIGLDDWEWGVTLFANDMVAIKSLLTEMRFDPSTSRFAEFGRFYVGRRFTPADLPAVLAGDPVSIRSNTAASQASIAEVLAAFDLPDELPDETHAVVLYSTEPIDVIESELDDMADHFTHYDSHVLTTTTVTESSTQIASVWTTARAVETATGFLEELPGVVRTLQGSLSDPETSAASTSDAAAEDIRSSLETAGVYAGRPHGEDVHALVSYSTADAESVASALGPIIAEFDRNEAHRRTDLYSGTRTERVAVVSLWETAERAEAAASTLQEIPEIERTPSGDAGFTTMGLFYRVKPAHREDFLDTFDGVATVLEDMEGHRETDLLVNHRDEHDMFIASRWRAKEDAMAFFRSDAFRDTVQFGRDILADRPRHVFLV